MKELNRRPGQESLIEPKNVPHVRDLGGVIDGNFVVGWPFIDSNIFLSDCGNTYHIVFMLSK